MKEIQLTRDYNKDISSISYDQFGNLFKVTFGNKSSIEYVYSADGIKLKARHITAIPQGTVTVGTGHCHLSLAFYQDYTLTQKMTVLVCILIQNTRIM